MRKIKDVLRLKLDAKLSHQQIAAALGISKGGVAKYASLAAAACLDWAMVQAMDETALQRRLLAAPERPRNQVHPDYGRLHQELRRKGMALMLCGRNTAPTMPISRPTATPSSARTIGASPSKVLEPNSIYRSSVLIYVHAQRAYACCRT